MDIKINSVRYLEAVTYHWTITTKKRYKKQLTLQAVPGTSRYTRVENAWEMIDSEILSSSNSKTQLLYFFKLEKLKTSE